MHDLSDPGIGIIGYIDDAARVDGQAHRKTESGDIPITILETYGRRSGHCRYDARRSDQPDLVFIGGNEIPVLVVVAGESPDIAAEKFTASFALAVCGLVKVESVAH